MEALITVRGNAGADARMRTLEDGTPVTTFPVAHTPRIRRGGEWVDGPTTWYRVSCWRWLAERVRDSIRKGDAVIVQGKVRTEQWRDEAGLVREGQLIEATTVGHDLTRGTAVFTRVVRTPEDDHPLMESPAEERLAEEVERAEREESANGAKGRTLAAAS